MTFLKQWASQAQDLRGRDAPKNGQGTAQTVVMGGTVDLKWLAARLEFLSHWRPCGARG